MENQKSWQRLNTEVSISVKPFKDLLTMKFSGGMAHFDSRGLNYHHTYTNWYYNELSMLRIKIGRYMVISRKGETIFMAKQ
jgi:hypothetical protein